MAAETWGAPAAGPPTDLAGRFRAAIADDLNLPGALVVTWEVLREANRASGTAEKRAALDLLLDFDRVLGLRLAEAVDPETRTLPAKVAELVRRREAARAARDWPAADALRATIRQWGYEVEDTPSGTRWRQTRGG